jgi:two-component system, NtrC family, sensor kinase
MATLFDKLPTLLVLGVLVGIFVALGRHVNSWRLKLWTVAWGLIFVHFFVDLFATPQGDLPPSLGLISLGFLALSALFFVASLSVFYESRKQTIGLLVLTGVPVMIYAAALNYEWTSRAAYIACIAIVFFGTPVYVASFRRLTAESLGWMPLAIGAGGIAIVRVWRGDPNLGFLAILTLGFALPGFLFWRRYHRWSPGVFTSALGFLLWGLVWPIGGFLDWKWPNFHMNPELWNTPKLFVAFGMILTLLEDKSVFLKSANERETKLNRQLQKFAGITSRLLTGADLNSLCQEIAEAIAETSTFQRAIIVLSTEGRALHLTGHAGFEASVVRQIERKCADSWTVDHIAQICKLGVPLGQNSLLLKAPDADKFGPVPSSRQFDPNPYWQHGDFVLVPLQLGGGNYAGVLALDDPRDVSAVTAEEMSKIELLVGDLAVTLDNSALHRQLVRSEKLAAIGQLVAGVAHELNNPLASIVGYSELLTDEVHAGPPRQKLDKMIREAQRMRRIIENLLRFARQNTLEKKSANIHDLIHDVLALRDYHLRGHQVSVEVNVESGLPQVALDEDQFKQILINLLNNSIDALETMREKRIRVEASRRGDRVILCFEDSGPGFSNTSRAFDPFYTTKPVGKGTGLGLSICYGIVKEHGGDIQATNVDPHGARVTMELPIHSEVVAEEAAAR